MGLTKDKIATRLMLSVIILFVWGLTNTARSQTVVRYLPAENNQDNRSEYYIDLIKLSLEKTVDDFGSYEIKPGPVNPD